MATMSYERIKKEANNYARNHLDAITDCIKTYNALPTKEQCSQVAHFVMQGVKVRFK
jgi:hypothetical protein